jgi:putative ABC transport system substrate-binding protein
MAIHIRRREFIATLGGGAWPFGVRAQAQHGERLRRVVFLHSLAENDPEVQIRVAAFREGIEALGWTENRNIQVEHRFSGGDFARMQVYTTELVSSAPDLIVASSSPVLAALKQATHTIPIVFSVVNHPVGQGLVASLARPGGNITGFTFIDFPMIGKWMELLKEIAPSVRRMTLMFNSQTAPYYPVFLREFGSAPASLAVELSATPVNDEAEIKAAATASAREPGRWPDRRAGSVHQYPPRAAYRVGGKTSHPCRLWLSAVRHGGRSDVLWPRHCRYRPAFGVVCRSHSQGREAG